MWKAELDPIELEIAWGQLVAIIDEAALTLVQTAFSAVVREAKDYTIQDLSGSTENLPFVNPVRYEYRSPIEMLPMQYSADERTRLIIKSKTPTR